MLLVLSGGAATYSSFDMLLLPGADGRIYRHDPVNNVALGSYAAGVDNLIAVDSNGRSFSGSSGSTSFVASDYSTGEVLGGMTASLLRSTEISGSAMFGNSLSAIRRYDLNNGGQTNASTLSSAANWHTISSHGIVLQIIGIHATTGNIALQTALQSDTTPGAFFTTVTSLLAGSTLGKSAVAFNAISGTQQVGFTYLDPTGTLIFGRYSLNSSGAFASTSLSATALTGFTTAGFMPATVRSHSGWFIVGQDGANASLMRIQQFALIGNNAVRLQNYTITAPGGGFGTHTSGVYQPSNVVAPEPGSLAVLGLGASALFKRKLRRCRESAS